MTRKGLFRAIAPLFPLAAQARPPNRPLLPVIPAGTPDMLARVMAAAAPTAGTRAA